MATNNNQMQAQPSAGPVAQQLVKIQSNGHQAQAQFNFQQASGKQSHRKRHLTFSWTGFSGKTLWDWLQLLSLLAVPIAVAIASAWFSVQQNHSLQIAAAQRQQDFAITKDQQQQATLDTYLDRMQELLTNDNLSDPKAPSEVRALARARTLTALSRIDSDRKRIVIQFLYEANLINSKPIVDLKSADLSNANLNNINLTNSNLSGANLSGANLSNADLKGANLSGGTNLFSIGFITDTTETYTNLSGANLLDANLSLAHLSRAYFGCNKGPGFCINLSFADLSGADLSCITKISTTCIDLSGADLSNANLKGTSFSGANLKGANLSFADLGCATFGTVTSTVTHCTILSNANLKGANLSGAHFNSIDFRTVHIAQLYGYKLGCTTSPNILCAHLNGANLSDTNLSGANLSGADLRDANLSGANLSKADLTGTRVIKEQLAQAISLKGTIMPDGSKHR